MIKLETIEDLLYYIDEYMPVEIYENDGGELLESCNGRDSVEFKYEKEKIYDFKIFKGKVRIWINLPAWKRRYYES